MRSSRSAHTDLWPGAPRADGCGCARGTVPPVARPTRTAPGPPARRPGTWPGTGPRTGVLKGGAYLGEQPQDVRLDPPQLQNPRQIPVPRCYDLGHRRGVVVLLG